jgi:replicative DNA helicase
MKRLEKTILKNLIYNEEYARKVIPFIRPDYFSDVNEKNIFKEVQDFANKYKTLPTHEALVINFTESKSLTEPEVRSAISILDELHDDKDPSEPQWLIEQTEKFCQDKAIYNGIMEAVSILDDKTHTKGKGEIPKILSDALAVSFDNSVGHDYMQDSDSRYDFYHRVESRVRFDLDLFNKITKGGFPIKTLNVALAGTGVGKSLFMCHCSASSISQGHNVLYITMEMAEERIAERIDANLLNMTMDELSKVDKDIYETRIGKLIKKTNGKLIIKEYPTASAHAGHFRALLEELKLKRDFKPDIVIIDYLNICASSRIKHGSGVNSYTYIKSIAEELRGLGVEYNVPILSATQTTRGGYDNTDVDITDTSESFGLPATVDLMFALISTEELEQLGQIMVKQLKNRYNDPTMNKRFVVGIDRAKMLLYDVEQNAQKDILDSGKEEEYTYDENQNQSKFSGFKF